VSLFIQPASCATSKFYLVNMFYCRTIFFQRYKFLDSRKSPNLGEFRGKVEILSTYLCRKFAVKTDRNRCTRFRPKTKPGTKMLFYFRPKPKRNLSTIFGQKRNRKRKSLFSLISQLYYVNINSTVQFHAMSSLQRVQALN